MLWDEPKIFFLERRYFFSIILSEFLKNRVALQLRQRLVVGYLLCGRTKREGDASEGIPLFVRDFCCLRYFLQTHGGAQSSACHPLQKSPQPWTFWAYCSNWSQVSSMALLADPAAGKTEGKRFMEQSR